MKMEIVKKLTPYSHSPGASCMIPGTTFSCTAYPTRLLIPKANIEVRFELTGPVKGFTLEQDLEKDEVVIWGEAKEGYFRLKLSAQEKGFTLFVDRVFNPGISYQAQKEGILKKKESLFFAHPVSIHLPKKLERLSLGSHKKLEWEERLKQSHLEDLLPVLFLLGQKVPQDLPKSSKGTARLLNFPQERAKVPLALTAFFKTAFSHILVPRLTDEEYQGLIPDEEVQGDPCFLLSEGYQKIRSLFFRQTDRRVLFLPGNVFQTGRILSLLAEGIGEFDIEWSQKALKKIIFRSQTEGDLVLEFPKEIKSFLVREARKEKGKKMAVEEPFFVQKGKIYLLDRFQK